MSYYTQKQQFLNDIQEQIKTKQKVKESDLEYFAMANYGFSKKMLDQALTMAEGVGAIRKEDEYWVFVREV